MESPRRSGRDAQTHRHQIESNRCARPLTRTMAELTSSHYSASAASIGRALAMLLLTCALRDPAWAAPDISAEVPPCVFRLTAQVGWDEQIEVITDTDVVVRGGFRGVDDGFLHLSRSKPPVIEPYPIAHLRRLSYWRREFLQPEWIIAGVVSGVLAGALIGALTGDEDQNCQEFICDQPWLRGASVGIKVGLGAGLIASMTIPKKHSIECDQTE